MTIEEVIEVLENELKANCKVCVHPQEVGYCKNFCTYREAIDMAISALKEEKDGKILYKLSTPIEYIELDYTNKEVTKLSYDSNITLVTPKREQQNEYNNITESPNNVVEKNDDVIEPTDLISRAEAINKVMMDEYNLLKPLHKGVVEDYINNLPSVSAERVGEWDDVLETIINIESELLNLKELCGARMA